MLGEVYDLVDVTSPAGQPCKIRKYKLYAPNDFNAWRDLLRGLENRFVGHVSRGESIPPALPESAPDELKEKGFIASAEALKKQTDNPAQQAIIQSDIAVSHVKRGINLFKQWMDRLRETKCGYDDEGAQKLRQEAEQALFKGFDLAGFRSENLHRGSGTPDRDGILAEMIGELLRVQQGLNPNGKAGIEKFQNDRLIKISAAWDGIDKVHAALVRLIDASPPLRDMEVVISDTKKTTLKEVLADFVHNAKERAQMMKVDPEYYATDVAFRAGRKVLRENVPLLDAPLELKHVGKSYLFSGRSRSQEYINSLAAHQTMLSGAGLIYDMAKARGPQPVRVESFIERATHLGAALQAVGANRTDNVTLGTR